MFDPIEVQHDRCMILNHFVQFLDGPQGRQVLGEEII